MTGGSTRSMGARASAVRASAPTGGPRVRGVARGLREGAVRVGLGRAPCGSRGACASWATRGVSRPGGEEGETWAALGRLGVCWAERGRE